VGAAAYQQTNSARQAAPAGSGQAAHGSEDDVVDAEFTEH